MSFLKHCLHQTKCSLPDSDEETTPDQTCKIDPERCVGVLLTRGWARFFGSPKISSAHPIVNGSSEQNAYGFFTIEIELGSRSEAEVVCNQGRARRMSWQGRNLHTGPVSSINYLTRRLRVGRVNHRGDFSKSLGDPDERTHPDVSRNSFDNLRGWSEVEVKSSSHFREPFDLLPPILALVVFHALVNI